VRITSIDVSVLEVPLSASGYQPAWAPGMTYRSWPCSVVKIETEEGLVGIGGQKYWNPALEKLIEEILVEEVIDPFYVGRFSNKMGSLRNTYGDRFCGFEIALWDLIGKKTGRPIYNLLGVFRERVLAYASTAELRRPEERVKDTVRMLEEGFKAVKLRFHDPRPEKDIEIARAVRDAVGDSMEIMIDANQARPPPRRRGTTWSLKTALKICKRLERLDILWIEEPLPASDLSGLETLRKNTSIMIAGGEAEFGIHPFQKYVQSDSLDIIQPDPQYCGGILAAKKISTIAEASNKLCIPHSWGVGLIMAANLQLIGSLPNCPYIEFPYDPPGWTVEARDSILAKPFEIDSKGYVKIPDGPGLGIELNEEALRNCRVNR